MIYFDNAATSFPKPQIVKNNIKHIFNKFGGNPGRSGHKMAMETSEMIFNCRESIASLFNAYDISNVIFCLNTTMAINTVIKGLLKQGDHVVISNFEHNAVVRPLYKLKSLGLINYDIANIDELDINASINSFKNLIRKNTRLVIALHGSNVFGNILPIKEIADIAHQNGSLFLVDAAQSAGLLPIDIQNIGIDFLCLPAHKSLYGLAGLGILITKLPDKLSSLFEGGTGSLSHQLDQPNFLPDKFESGTINTIGVLSLFYGIKFIKYHGIDNLYSREIKITQRIYERLSQNKNIILYSNFPEKQRYLPVISFNINKLPCDEVVEALNKKGFALRGGLHCSPMAHQTKGTLKIGTVRASVGAFNTLSQADRLCNEILKLANNQSL